MKDKWLFTLVLVLSISFSFHAQKSRLSSFTLSDELTTNANAVVREESSKVIIEDIDKLTFKYRYVVTILNKIGHKHYFNALAYYDNDSKIKSISAKIYNASGSEIKKYAKSKFIDVSAVSDGNLYEDDRVLFVDYTPVSYPYTLVFEVERISKTTGFLPSWMPLKGYYLSVQNSSYRFTNKTNTDFRIKENNLKDFEVEKENLENGFLYKARNVKAIKYESYAPHFKSFFPELRIALNRFTLKGIEGEAGNWKTLGKWMHDELLKGKDQLSQSTKDHILSMIKGVEDPIERAKIVYEFVQDKTRYISVQVGIGGWEPIAANQVDDVGYGDCKGLTNYTKALLDVAGVRSYYTVVHAGKKVSIDDDFASIEGNHVILNIPNNDKDIWLECTSQKIPFGFLGDFTDDRKVLVVTPEGGLIKKTTRYVNDDNFRLTKASVQLFPEGGLVAKVTIQSKGLEYDKKHLIADESDVELRKYYTTSRWSYNNNLEILKADIINEKDSLRLWENVELKMDDYASPGKDEMLFRVNVFNRNSSVPKRYRNRKLPFEVSRGYKHRDQYEITLPEGYVIDYLPQPKNLTNKFGEYKVVMKKINENTISYDKTLLIKQGQYAKEDYEAYRKFRKAIAKYENLRIAVAKTL